MGLKGYWERSSLDIVKYGWRVLLQNYRNILQEDYSCKNMISWTVLFIMLMFAVKVEALPVVLDPNYSLTLVATGLGAAADMAIDNEGNMFLNDYRDPGTGTGKIYWFKPNGEMQVINSNLYYQDGIAVLPNGNLLVAPDALYEVTRDGAVSLYLTGLSYPGHMEPDGLGNLYISEGALSHNEWVIILTTKNTKVTKIY